MHTKVTKAMQAIDQGTRETNRRRYQAIPRTLIFLTSRNSQTDEQEVLLLKGAPNKRLWANRYNGLGGHVEVDEDIYNAALREVGEETGLTPASLELRAIINIDTGSDENGQRPGVLVFVFWGESPNRQIQATHEGTPEWIPLDALASLPLVDDLYELIPRTRTPGPLVFGHYSPQPTGTLRYTFR